MAALCLNASSHCSTEQIIQQHHKQTLAFPTVPLNLGEQEQAIKSERIKIIGELTNYGNNPQ